MSRQFCLRPLLALACVLAWTLAPPSARAQVADADGDGLPDDWEVLFGLDPLVGPGDPTGPTGDPDRDGLTNLASSPTAPTPAARSRARLPRAPRALLRRAIRAVQYPPHLHRARAAALHDAAPAPTVTHFLVLAPLARAAARPRVAPRPRRRGVLDGARGRRRVIVDRTMWWDATHYGSHAETGVAAPSLAWFLAEGATHSGFASTTSCRTRAPSPPTSRSPTCCPPVRRCHALRRGRAEAASTSG